MTTIARTSAAALVTVILALTAAPALADEAPTPEPVATDCSVWTARLDNLSVSWEERDRAATAWEGRASALTVKLAASEAARQAEAQESARLAAKVERLQDRIARVRASNR